MKKRLLLVTIFIFLILSVCSSQTNDRDKELYSIINTIVNQDFDDTKFIVLELNKVCLSSVITIDLKGDTIKDIPPPPPPPGLENCYCKEMFENWVDDKKLLPEEADYMFNQINKSKISVLDSTKIDRRILHVSKLYSSFRKYGIDSTYRLLRNTYGSSRFIQISQPLYSENGNKVIISIDYHCGGLCGGGSTYLLERRDSKWVIIHRKGNWVS